MPHGGRRPGAGRKPGSKDKTLEAKAVIEKHAAALPADIRPDIAAMTPLAVMLHAMALKANADDWMAAAALAKEAAPYLHPKLSSETLNVRNDDSKRSEDDIRAELAEIERREALGAAAGTAAPRVPPKLPGVLH